MTTPLRPEQLASMMQRHRSHPWVWLFEITIRAGGTTPVGALRAARNSTAVDWGELGDGTAKEFRPVHFEVDTIKADAEGGQQTIAISVSNVSRDVESLLEHYDGLEGESIWIGLVHVNELDSTEPYWELEGEVLTATSNERTATIQVGQPSLEHRPFPNQRVSREVCRHWRNGDYGGTNCGYDTARPNSLQTCDGTLDGHNGCVAHGENEEAAGLAVLHPLRFGGEQGVRRRVGIGT